MKKFIILSAAVMTVASAYLFAPHTKLVIAQEDVIELDFWSFWGSEPRRNFIEQIVEDFNRSQAEIHVTHTFLPWGDIWTKNLASIAAGDPADVIINDINSTRQRAQKNQNTNLAEFIAQEEADFAEQYYPHLWEATVYEGNNYAIPFNTDTRILFYNKDMFEEVGLDPEQPPTTWEELKEMAQQLDVIDGNRYERLGYIPRYGIQGDVYYMNATGHGFWDFENNQPIINDPKGVEILDWVMDFEQDYGSDNLTAFTAEFGNQQADPFMSGKIAMMVKEATHYSQIAAFAPDLNFGVAELPEFQDGYGHTSWGGGFVAEIPYGAEHPEASWEFIKYLTGVEAQEYWAVNNFDNVAHIQASQNAFENEGMTEKGLEVYQVAVDNLAQTILTPVPLELPDILSIVNPEFDLIYLGQKTPQEALENAQQMAEQQMMPLH
ncbi:ABC transporter substrate-binding protein [Fundicoccus culcitae]|uniref:ABC transporter substrate-binding protein n=1 Tax=Fundicoccus culcitae TaxID=2969821 RepID=A0ABY5P593_9LACT|nr:ABC transporter substrate-binding protein [Fundicoccus culcitae]UUX33719.1 ABC transporter substrate-binding protein [Fundicoccus culcitae]